MIPRRERVPIGRERMRGERCFSSPYFLIQCAENRAGHDRFGVIISVKAGRTAAYRHFVKRRVLLYARAAFQAGAREKGRDFLFIVSPALAKVPRPQIPSLLREEIERAGKSFRAGRA